MRSSATTTGFPSSKRMSAALVSRMGVSTISAMPLIVMSKIRFQSPPRGKRFGSWPTAPGRKDARTELSVSMFPHTQSSLVNHPHPAFIIADLVGAKCRATATVGTETDILSTNSISVLSVTGYISEVEADIAAGGGPCKAIFDQ